MHRAMQYASVEEMRLYMVHKYIAHTSLYGTIKSAVVHILYTNYGY